MDVVKNNFNFRSNLSVQLYNRGAAQIESHKASYPLELAGKVGLATSLVFLGIAELFIRQGAAALIVVAMLPSLIVYIPSLIASSCGAGKVSDTIVRFFHYTFPGFISSVSGDDIIRCDGIGGNPTVDQESIDKPLRDARKLVTEAFQVLHEKAISLRLCESGIPTRLLDLTHADMKIGLEGLRQAIDALDSIADEAIRSSARDATEIGPWSTPLAGEGSCLLVASSSPIEEAQYDLRRATNDLLYAEGLLAKAEIAYYREYNDQNFKLRNEQRSIFQLAVLKETYASLILKEQKPLEPAAQGRSRASTVAIVSDATAQTALARYQELFQDKSRRLAEAIEAQRARIAALESPPA